MDTEDLGGTVGTPWNAGSRGCTKTGMGTILFKLVFK